MSVPVYTIDCAGCGTRWTAIFADGHPADERGGRVFGVECPSCGQPHGCSDGEPPAHFDSIEDAKAFLAAPDAEVIPLVSR